MPPLWLTSGQRRRGRRTPDSLQLTVERKSPQTARGPESRAVPVADDLQRLGDCDVRRRRGIRLLQREDQARCRVVLSLSHVQQNQVLVRLGIARIELDLFLKCRLGLRGLSHSSQSVTALKVQTGDRRTMLLLQDGCGLIEGSQGFLDLALLFGDLPEQHDGSRTVAVRTHRSLSFLFCARAIFSTAPD